MSFITTVVKTGVIKKTIDSINCSKTFYDLYKTEEVLETIEDDLNINVHTIKSLDGLDIKTYEDIIDDESDYVLLVHDIDSSIDSIDGIKKMFLSNNLNTIKLQTRTGLFNYSKEYLDIITALKYYRDLYPNKRIYLYGKGVGANMCAEALKTDISKYTNVVILDEIKLNYLYEIFKNYAIKSKLLNVNSLINKVNKTVIKNGGGDLRMYRVDDALIANDIPVIFIKEDKQNSKRFLKFYNSTKGTKKILYLDNNLSNEDKNNKYKNLCEVLKNI